MPDRGHRQRSPMAPWRWCLVAWGLLAIPVCTVAAAGPVRNQQVTTPREFGYAIGDQVVMRVDFELARDWRLDRDALPKPGRITRWLALNRVGVSRGLGWSWVPHTVSLVYQVVNTPDGVLGVGTPPWSLRVLGAHDDLPVIVPAWGFTIAPITASSERPEGALPPLRPPLPPPALDTRASLARVALAAAGALAVALWLAYLHLMLPFVSRTRGPFARACREIARIRRRENEDVAYQAALAAVHRAFNATAGRVVFEHELDGFFREHPRFETLRKPVAHVFECSTAEFFGDGGGTGAARERLEELLELCRACRDRERSVA